MLGVVRLNVVRLIVVMLIVVMLIVVMLSVVAPFLGVFYLVFCLEQQKSTKNIFGLSVVVFSLKVASCLWLWGHC